ncbi:hypothetical protein DRQ09_09695 [candidate division KSB1 bacterium]|nr:MAG: hypothetical protein DRQ09_09695 [candidate division KSB1 bacterium]
MFSMLDIMVNTSAIGSFPTSILEAMIFKVPIITLYNPGIMNIMRDEYNCLILKDNDASSIGDAVIRLLKDVELSNKLTVNALNTFEEKCSFEKTFDEISAISNL